jgi:hypothetical protein
MPRIRRHDLPPQLFAHLLDRIHRRNISAEPEVLEGKWFKKFSGMTVCGEGELVKTFLQPGQIATGEELN